MPPTHDNPDRSRVRCCRGCRLSSQCDVQAASRLRDRAWWWAPPSAREIFPLPAAAAFPILWPRLPAQPPLADWLAQDSAAWPALQMQADWPAREMPMDWPVRDLAALESAAWTPGQWPAVVQVPLSPQ